MTFSKTIRKRRIISALFLSAAVLAPPPAWSATAFEEGWTRLGPTAWHNSDKWCAAGDATLNPDNPRLLVGKPGKGVLINGEVDKCPGLVTKQVFQDVELHVEFMVAKGSNSGVIFHGNHEIQILDSAHVKAPTGAHCGGVYPRAEAKPTYHHIDKGSPPRVNAALPPGKWQTFDIIFQAARFDEAGKKTANARFVKVVHNGKVIQENVEVPYACGPNWDRKQRPRGVIIFQGDYGPVAFRNIRVRPWKGAGSESELNVPPEGFTALFNGKDFSGFHMSPRAKAMWTIEDGVLKAPKLLEQWGADLVTKGKYKDFVLLADFRMPKGSDSGIHFRQFIPDMGYFSQNEQINLGTGHRMGQVESFGYMKYKKLPIAKRLKPNEYPKVKQIAPEPGQWHTIKITMQGRTLSIEVDGETTLDKFVYPAWLLGDEPVPLRFQKHRFTDMGNGRRNPCPIEYRNLFIKGIDASATVGDRKLNVPPEGFTTLFNGKDFTNWRVSPKVRKFWSIEDGVLKSPGLLAEWGADLTTVKNYRDFVLILEFRMPTISDSGIMFRRLTPQIPGFGTQEQFNLRSKGGMGHLESYYFLPKATAKARGLKQETKPHVRHIDPEVGVWHKVKITMRGRTITTELDGEVLLDNFTYHDWMLNMEPAPIRLQKHKVVRGDNLGKENPCPIEYRNIFIKELEPPKQNIPPKGFTALFNGKDLTGWRIPPKVKDVWSVANGVLKANGPVKQWMPNIETVKTYRDFVLLIDYRMPTTSDSGIFIRGLVPVLEMGRREQIDLGAGRMGHPLSFHYLTPEIKLKRAQLPDIKHIRPEVGRWHTVKITLVGKTLSIKVDDEVILREFEYPEGILSMKPSPIGLQKHKTTDPSGDGKMSSMPIEFRNIFIKEITPSVPNVPPKGFTALFNGKNFNGWRLSPAVREAWSIEDGILKSHKPIKDWGSDLRTVKKYRDFVLLVDYRIPRISDSGIYIRGLMPGIGIFDRDRWEQFNLRSRGATGTLESFRFQPPDRRVAPPPVRPIDPEVGVWHTVKLTLVAKTLSAEYDGETIIDKYEYADGVLSMEPSVIRLQKHPPSEIGGEMSDCPIEFRNVFIKELKPSGFPKVVQRPRLNAPPRGFAALFNGKDLTGWQVTPAVKKAWKIEDGVLKAHGEIKEWGADLVTRKKYRDFILLVDFRFPTISDSGIWFRGIPGIMGGMEQFNLMSVNGTGNLDSLDHLPKDVQLSFRDAAYTPFFYCQPEYYRLKEPPVRYTDPQVGAWHTVKLTLIGRTLSAEYDGQVMHDRFEYPEGTISMEPSVIRLQKHIPQRIAGKLYRECPIEFRNVFIKQVGPGGPAARGAARPVESGGATSPRTKLAELLIQIDKNDLPKGYIPAKHQEYVDRRLAQMTERQKALLARLWAQKRRIDPQMPNRGASFVKIMAYAIDNEIQ